MMADRPFPPAMRARALFYALAAIPFFDCIFDQLNNALRIAFGPVSLLQVVHGSLMLVFTTISLRAVYTNPQRLKRVPLSAVGAFLLIAIVSTKELAVTGTLTMASIGAYGQMAYWVLFWTTVTLVCEQREQAETLLRGLAIGAVATAASVFLGLIFGAQNYYSTDAVESSAGWFDTAKMITGVLVVGGVVLLYLGRRRKSWLYPMLTCVCFAACVVTYARAGSVALGAVLLWLPMWALLFGRGAKKQWVSRFLLLALAAAILVPAVVGTGKLFARWGDVKEGDQAGSGRAAFWKIAYDSYIDSTPAEQALGRGYHAMSEMLLRGYGMDIKHTHNDLLDMLTVGGLTGAAWLFLLVGSILWRVARDRISSIEGGAAMAIVLAYLLHSQFTGQIWGTDAMSYYTVSLTCLSRLSVHNASQATQQTQTIFTQDDTQALFA